MSIQTLFSLANVTHFFKDNVNEYLKNRPYYLYDKTKDELIENHKNGHWRNYLKTICRYIPSYATKTSFTYYSELLHVFIKQFLSLVHKANDASSKKLMT